MKKIIITMVVLSSLFLIGSAMAMDSMSKDSVQQEGQATMDHSKMGSMDHSAMGQGASQAGGMSKEMVMVDGIDAEFQIMDLASMKMTDPDGRTHHVMVSFMKNGEKIDKVVGKVKLISPSGKEQIAELKDFGNGIFAANFTIDEKGKWGVICLFKDMDGKHTAKFWYDNGMM